MICKVIQTFQKYYRFFIVLLIWENSQSLHLFNCFQKIRPYKFKVKSEYVYKGLMTLIPSKWKRTVLFCNLKVCQHVFPRKQKFIKILIYTNELHPFQKMSFQNDLKSPSFHFWNTFFKRGTQLRYKIKVHNWDHKSSYTVKTQDIQKQKKNWIIWENMKSFQYRYVLGCCKHLKSSPMKKKFHFRTRSL